MRSSSTAEALSPIYPKWDGPPSRKPTATLDTFCHLHGSYQRTRHPSAVSLPRSLIFYISFSVISELHVDLHRRDLLSPNKLNKAPRNLPSFLLINILLQKNFWYYIIDTTRALSLQRRYRQGMGQVDMLFQDLCTGK